jgi:hypothetical protein
MDYSGWKEKFNTKTFIERAIIIHGHYYDYSSVNYVLAKIKVAIICPEHGLFYQTPDKHLLGRGCRKCGFRKCAKSITLTTEKFIEMSKEKYGDRFDYGSVSYIKTIIPVILRCIKHNETFSTTPNNHLISTSNGGCKSCHRDVMIAQKTLPVETVLANFKLAHGDLYDYSFMKYVRQRDKILIGCKKHGLFSQTPNSHSQGAGCPKCTHTISIPEIMWLDSLGIPNDDIHRQVKLPIGTGRKKADGFDPDTNTIYEFYGDYWHGNPKFYDPNDIHPENKYTYGQLYERTLKREKLICDHGYKLITIWQSDFISLVQKTA